MPQSIILWESRDLPTLWALLLLPSSLWRKGIDKLPPSSNLLGFICVSMAMLFCVWVSGRPYTQPSFSHLLLHTSKNTGAFFLPGLESRPDLHICSCIPDKEQVLSFLPSTLILSTQASISSMSTWWWGMGVWLILENTSPDCHTPTLSWLILTCRWT